MRIDVQDCLDIGSLVGRSALFFGRLLSGYAHVTLKSFSWDVYAGIVDEDGEPFFGSFCAETAAPISIREAIGNVLGVLDFGNQEQEGFMLLGFKLVADIDDHKDESDSGVVYLDTYGVDGCNLLFSCVFGLDNGVFFIVSELQCDGCIDWDGLPDYMHAALVGVADYCQ